MQGYVNKPGSPAAVKLGCTCKGGSGKGWMKNGLHYGWDVAFDCPLCNKQRKKDD